MPAGFFCFNDRDTLLRMERGNSEKDRNGGGEGEARGLAIPTSTISFGCPVTIANGTDPQFAVSRTNVIEKGPLTVVMKEVSGDEGKRRSAICL